MLHLSSLMCKWSLAVIILFFRGKTKWKKKKQANSIYNIDNDDNDYNNNNNNTSHVMAWLRKQRFKKFVHVDVDCRRACACSQRQRIIIVI